MNLRPAQSFVPNLFNLIFIKEKAILMPKKNMDNLQQVMMNISNNRE